MGSPHSNPFRWMNDRQISVACSGPGVRDGGLERGGENVDEVG